MKLAMVYSWPSPDAPAGAYVSAWEQQVISELQQIAGYEADAFCAFPTYRRPNQPLFEKGQPLPEAVAARDALVAQLAGYDVALTFGSFAMWCLTGEQKLDLYRGTHMDSNVVPGLQVVPTYAPHIFCHVAWNERPVVVAAMRKAQSKFLDKPRTIYLPDNVADLYAFSTHHIKDQLVFDVETNVKGRITEFSVSPNSSCCLYVQLEDRTPQSIWPEQDELDIMLWLHFLAARKDLAWGFHNATYDLTYLDKYGIRPAGRIFDTMLMHHAYQPEWEKSLGFLAALHVPTRAWKHLRKQSKKSINKAGAVE